MAYYMSYGRIREIKLNVRKAATKLASLCDYNQFHNILRLFDVLPNFPFGQLLLINIVYTSCLTSCRTT